MRLNLRTTPNMKPVPFNYQRKLVGTFHKWMGKNDLHDTLSLYSLGWLSGGKATKGALDFKAGAHWSISSPDSDVLLKLINSIQAEPTIAYGMEVNEILVQHEPIFQSEARFVLQSPVLIKRTLEDKVEKYYYHTDDEAGALLSETLAHKLKQAGKEHLKASVGFDRTYPKAQLKMINYNGVHIKGSICPIIIKGDPEAIAFAWNVGIGNSTGIGFGALK